MYQVNEVTLSEGILRVELDSVEVDGAGRVIAYLNDNRITKEQAEELLEKARNRRGRSVVLVDADELLAEFVRLLTTDSPHQDRRRCDFNQAVFMADGKPVWTETTLDMITGKFKKAARNLGCCVTGQGDQV